VRMKLCCWLCNEALRTLFGEDEKTGSHTWMRIRRWAEKTGRHMSETMGPHGAAGGIKLHGAADGEGRHSPEKTGCHGARVKLHGAATGMRIRRWAAEKTGHMRETMGRHGAGRIKMHGAAVREQISCHGSVQFNLHRAVTGQVREGDHV
jgi:hypothetical protein